MSIVTRPEETTGVQLAEALNGLVGMDRQMLSIRCDSSPPCIVLPIHQNNARAAIQAIEQCGCNAIAPSLADLQNVGETIVVRDVRLDENGLVLETRNHGTQYVPICEIAFYVMCYEEPVGQEELSPEERNQRMPTHVIQFTAPRVSYDISKYQPKALFDIHTTGPKIFQIDARKFTFALLGSRRMQSDLMNVQLLLEWFMDLTPEIPIDCGFTGMSLPFGYERLRLPRAMINNDDLGFAFYSRWLKLAFER